MADNWRPNEEFLHALVSMGISHEIAIQALFCTGNTSVDEAVNYVFNNEDENSLQHTFGDGDNSDDESEEEEYYKMIFVVNTSLKMGVGKIAAQVGHACLGLYRDMLRQKKDEWLNKWENIGEKKIVLKGNDENHLQELQEKALINNIPCYLVHDAGHTQVAPNSITVLSLFGLEDDVNNITGKLGLL